jgi:hypothetical protein
MRALLEQGADVTIQDDDGCTPLHLVLGRYQWTVKYVEVMRALVDSRCRV